MDASDSEAFCEVNNVVVVAVNVLTKVVHKVRVRICKCKMCTGDLKLPQRLGVKVFVLELVWHHLTSPWVVQGARYVYSDP